MTFNVGNLIYQIINILVALPQKLYDVINYPVPMKWLNDLLSFFNVNIGIPETISLIAIVGSIGAVTLVAIIIYNIFKL